MNEFRVPTVQLEAEVSCSDGQILKGFIFMPVLSAVHAGRMRPSEWINGRNPFFPFRLADANHSILVNKARIVALAVPLGANADEGEWTSTEAPVKALIIEAGTRRFEGRVVIDMPVNQQRVVDYLNREEEFLLLAGETEEYFINKPHILRVMEKEGA